MEAAGLTIWRICLPAWVGIACFFLVEVVSLRASDLFSLDAKLNHPRVLFPVYYEFEFALLALSLAGGWVARRHPHASSAAWRTSRGLAALALLLAVVDYVWVYRPLAAMLPVTPLPAEFAAYHLASRWINTAVVVACGTASLMTAWPGKGPAANAPGLDHTCAGEYINLVQKP